MPPFAGPTQRPAASRRRNESASPDEVGRGHRRRPGGRRLGPQAHARRLRPRHARHRRRDRGRHLLRHRHRGGRRGGGRRHRRALRGRSRPRRLLRPPRRGVRSRRAVLRGAHRAHPDLRQRLHLRLRDPGRARGLDHRLGPDPRVRGRQRGGGDRLVRLLQLAPPLLRGRLPLLALPQLPRRDALLPRAGGGPADRPRPPRGAEPPRHRDRRPDHLGAGPGHAGERVAQQRDGGPEAGGPRPLRGGGRPLPRPAELGALRPQRLARDPPGGGHRLLRLHRLRRGLDRGRGDEGPAAEHAAGHPGLARDLHPHLRGGGPRGDRARALPAAEGLGSPGPGLRGGRAWAGARRSSRSARSSR